MEYNRTNYKPKKSGQDKHIKTYSVFPATLQKISTGFCRGVWVGELQKESVT